VNEYAFATLGLGAVDLVLLGTLVCVLAEMRHRGKRTYETQDCSMRAGSVDSSGGDGMPVQAESVLPEQHLRKSAYGDGWPREDVTYQLHIGRRRGRLRVRCLCPHRVYTLRVLWRKADR
jgi:hypothetical protein